VVRIKLMSDFLKRMGRNTLRPCGTCHSKGLHIPPQKVKGIPNK